MAEDGALSAICLLRSWIALRVLRAAPVESLFSVLNAELHMSVASERADARDAGFMRRALTLAKKGWGQTAPNPMVGAVVVKENVVVGEGYHVRYGEPHAEIEALRAAGERARGATVYVSLEPCAHFGKTPPCVDALIAAGVARVVAATRDPSPPASGGAERLRAAGINVAFDVEAAAARELNAPFFHAVVSDRPWVSVKLALSIDGAIADASRGIHSHRGHDRDVHRRDHAGARLQRHQPGGA